MGPSAAHERPRSRASARGRAPLVAGDPACRQRPRSVCGLRRRRSRARPRCSSPMRVSAPGAVVHDPDDASREEHRDAVAEVDELVEVAWR